MFGRVDYGQVIKVFGNVQDATRYTPGRIIECKLCSIAGNPDENRINTSHSERFNLSIRAWHVTFHALGQRFLPVA